MYKSEINGAPAKNRTWISGFGGLRHIHWTTGATKMIIIQFLCNCNELILLYTGSIPSLQGGQADIVFQSAKESGLLMTGFLELNLFPNLINV